MAGNIEIRVASDAVRRRLANIPSGIFKISMMKEIGEYLKFRIKSRTQEGKDKSNRRFKPYSPEYKIFREKHGRPTSKVNLTFTGSMLSAMDYVATDRSVRLFFQNTEDESGAKNPIKAMGLQRNREFFGIGKGDRAGIRRIINSYARRALSGR